MQIYVNLHAASSIPPHFELI